MANYFRSRQEVALNSTRTGVMLLLSSGGEPHCMTLSKRASGRGLATVFRGRLPIRGGKALTPVRPPSSATHFRIRLPVHTTFGRVGGGCLITISLRRLI